MRFYKKIVYGPDPMQGNPLFNDKLVGNIIKKLVLTFAYNC